MAPTSRYFIGGDSGNTTGWDVANNWAATSGGTPGAGVPTASTAVYFDPHSVYDCDLSSDVTFATMTFMPGWSKNFNANGYILNGQIIPMDVNAYTNPGVQNVRRAQDGGVDVYYFAGEPQTPTLSTAVNIMSPAEDFDISYTGLIQIYGGHFGATQGSGYVIMGEHQAIIDVWEDDNIGFHQDPVYNFKQVRSYDISVHLDNGTIISQPTMVVNYTNQLKVTQCAPTGGAFESTVIFFGTYLGDIPGTIEATANGINFYSCLIGDWTDTYISFLMPANIPEANVGDAIAFRLTTGETPTPRIYTVENSYVLMDYSLITNYEPASVDQSFTDVFFSISGTGFNADIGRVLLDTEELIIDNWSDSQIDAHRDPLSTLKDEGSYTVTVFKSNSRPVTNTFKVKVENKMVVSGLYPAGGLLTGSEPLYIQGQYFGAEQGTVDMSAENAPAVWYPLEITSWDVASISCLTSGMFSNSMSANIKITTSTGRVHERAVCFYYYAPPISMDQPGFTMALI